MLSYVYMNVLETLEKGKIRVNCVVTTNNEAIHLRRNEEETKIHFSLKKKPTQLNSKKCTKNYLVK